MCSVVRDSALCQPGRALGVCVASQIESALRLSLIR